MYIVDYTLAAGLSQSSGESLTPRGGGNGSAIVVANTTTGAALTNGAVGGGCVRCGAADITAYLNGIAAQLNIDGNPSLTPLTDGLLVLRYLFGFTARP